MPTTFLVCLSFLYAEGVMDQTKAMMAPNSENTAAALRMPAKRSTSRILAFSPQPVGLGEASERDLATGFLDIDFCFFRTHRRCAAGMTENFGAGKSNKLRDIAEAKTFGVLPFGNRRHVEYRTAT